MKKIDINVLMLATAIVINTLLLLLDRPKPTTTTEALSVLANLSLLILGIVAITDLIVKK